MADNSERIDMLNSNIFDEMIASKMDAIDKLKNKLPNEKIDLSSINYVDKSFFKRVLPDITDVYIENSTLNVCFERGIFMKIESANENTDHDAVDRNKIEYRALKVIRDLVDQKEIVLRTSPFTVILKEDELRAIYESSLHEKAYDFERVVNIHDGGINCWGGFGGPIRSNYNEYRMEESLLIMVQRMKQLNIDDYSGDIRKMSYLIIKSYRGEHLSINPMVLAPIIIKHKFAANIIENSSRYFTRNNGGKLVLLMDVTTNIDYDVFVELLKKIIEGSSF